RHTRSKRDWSSDVCSSDLHKSAKVNAIRTQNAMKKCDLAVIRFGDKYKQWNAAFDAGFCAALGKPYITLHDEDIVHPLKEVDAEIGRASCRERMKIE